MWPFLAAALPVWLLVLAIFLWLRTQDPGAKIGAATALTLSRGLLLGAMAGFLPYPQHGWIAWAPGLLYAAAAIADLFDGYLARRRDEITTLGARLDVSLDALGLVVAPLAAIILGRLPPWYLILGASYYVFRGGLRLRRRLGLPLHEHLLQPDPRARMYAGYQMGLVATALFPVLGAPGTTIAAGMFMVPTLGLFGREWLLVTGWWRPETGRATFLAARRLLDMLLPALRGLAAAGIGVLVEGGRLSPALLLAAALLAGGVLTRLTAYVAAAFLTLTLGRHEALPLVIYVATLLLLLAGGGRGVLWNPEDRWLFMRAGTPRRAAT
jgi:CDP-diacylglycerol--glycerol-3-phosphate 3-phosphatidyltransferase